MIIQEIIFLQCEDANEAMNILDEHGSKGLFNHLLQWDNGDSVERTISNIYDIIGSNDTVKYFSDYIVTYNTYLNYVGLIKVIKGEN